MPIKTDARLFLLALVATTSALAQAQTATPPPVVRAPRGPTLEVTYDYIHSNGPPHACGCFSFNGGGAAFTYPLRSSNFDLIGKIGTGYAGGISSNNLGLTLMTYTVGERYYPKWSSEKWHPYGELQVGGAYATGDLISTPNAGGPNNHSAFVGATGAGLNYRFSPRLDLKMADVQYLVTTFANGDTDHQNNLRVGVGIVIRLDRNTNLIRRR